MIELIALPVGIFMGVYFIYWLFRFPSELRTRMALKGGDLFDSFFAWFCFLLSVTAAVILIGKHL